MLYRFTKRCFDLFSSLLALLILSPLFLLICVGIKLSSKGPVFYISERIWKIKAPFKMYKFRSMHVRQEGTVESKYVVNEQRIFKFGKFIRKSKLDELPQLINVLIGNMSVVGPRPYSQKFTDKHYIGAYTAIMSVRPGLTCLDSLYDYAHGELFVKDEEEYKKNVLPVRTKLAFVYTERKSINLDIYCIWRTLFLIVNIVVLKKRSFPYTRFEAEAIEGIKS